jgi:hypothetical protein
MLQTIPSKPIPIKLKTYGMMNFQSIIDLLLNEPTILRNYLFPLKKSFINLAQSSFNTPCTNSVFG